MPTTPRRNRPPLRRWSPPPPPVPPAGPPRPNPLKDGCSCPACQALRAEVGSNPVLVALYGKKLLYHGWGGKLTEAERAYRVAHSERARNAAERGRLNTAWRTRGPEASEPDPPQTSPPA